MKRILWLLIVICLFLRPSFVVAQDVEIPWFHDLCINIAGGEFGTIPGTLFQDYIYPSWKDDLQKWKNIGISCFR